MKSFFSVILLFVLALPALGQQVSGTAHVGTFGIGADAAVGFDSPVSVRAGISVVPFSASFTTDEIDFDANLPATRLSLLADFNIPKVPLRLTAGFTHTGDSYDLVAMPTENITIGDTEYTPSEVGTLTGIVRTRELSPYAGIGIGKLPTQKVGFFLDLGVLFHGSPEIDYEVDGALANDADFLIELEKERLELEDELEPVKFFPVLKIGVSFGILR